MDPLTMATQICRLQGQIQLIERMLADDSLRGFIQGNQAASEDTDNHER